MIGIGNNKLMKKKAVSGFVNYKYYRLVPVDSSGNPTTLNSYIYDWALYTGMDLFGTKYPTTHLTSDTSDSDVAISTPYYYTDYDAWKSFDYSSTVTGWWSLGVSNASDNYLQIEFLIDVEILSMYININSGSGTLFFKLYGSHTGEFTGEETLLAYKSDTGASLYLNL